LGDRLGLPSLSQYPQLRKPITRGDCVGGIRPCPWRKCRYHLQHQETHTGAGRPYKAGPVEGETCSLDVADAGENTLEDVGEHIGVVRERVRQIETIAIAKLRRRFPDSAALGLFKLAGA